MFRTHKKRALAGKGRNFAGAGEDVALVSNASYPHRLNFYAEPPRAEIGIEEFETWAIDRLYVLGEIESAAFRNKSPREMETMVKDIIDKHMPLASNAARALRGGKAIDAERRKDHFSHYILRLAFCRSEELRQRFARAETMLFRLRFMTDDARERQAFIEQNNFDWEVVPDTEKARLHDQLVAASGRAAVEGGDSSFFAVDFERVPDLVQQRRVYLEGGKAYVPTSEQLSLVLAEFQSRLERALEQTARVLPRLDEDDRLIPILNHLSLGFVAPEYTSQRTAGAGAGEITAAQVEGLVAHFPLCMRNMHSHLVRHQHLRYQGRQQYGLFLKAIGLSVDEAVVFWRKAFAKFTDDKFNKEYRYNIRHMYGLEGSRNDYRAKNCQQIIADSQPAAGDCHGCPYRYFSPENLDVALARMGITGSKQLREVHDAISGKHYHVACTKVYEFTHGDVTLKESISHPNQYFDLSYSSTTQ